MGCSYRTCHIKIYKIGEKMLTLIEVLNKEFAAAFAACGYDEKYGRVGVSNRPDLCEYQCNGAMAAAKSYGKPPYVIADEVVAKLQESGSFAKIEGVKPGFINFSVSADFLVDYLKGMAQDDRYGYSNGDSPKTVIVDYGGANAAKPLHVGHLRSAVIGESIKRLQRFAGNNVIGDVHLGDWGLQMGLIIEELRDRQPDLVYFDADYSGEYPEEPPFTIAELEEIYPAASAKSKEDEAFMERAHLATVRLQNGDPAFTAIWNHIMTVSKADLKKNYDSLNVHFDLWKGESDAQPYIPDMIDRMLRDGVAHESQGAIVVDIQEEGDTKELPPCLVRKSDGAALYATSDLATLVQREQDYHPDAYIYLADKRQELHFIQVFRTAKKAGIVPKDAQMTFLGFGTMNGKDGKPFKTRSGGVMRLQYLIEDINNAVYERSVEGRSMDEAEAAETSRIVGLAALKYGDLSNQASKDYVFDIDRFTSFEGNTGPYILYTDVRIKSIFAKYRDKGGSVEGCTLAGPVNESEKKLMLSVARFNEVVDAAYRDNAPHKLCQFIYEVADAFSGFYHDTQILGEQDGDRQKGFIALLALTKGVLEQSLDLLGIETPEKM
jgi:arginyl-tRNA synthetase